MKQNISQAIYDAEKKTSGEIACVVTKESYDYQSRGLLLAIFITLLLPLLNDIQLYLSWSAQSTFNLTALNQIFLFSILFFIFSFSPLKYFLYSTQAKKRYAQHFGFQQFFTNQLHTTQNNTGILIFISYAERYAEILADKGINQQLDQSTWEDIMCKLTNSIKHNKSEQGLITAITACGDILSQHFPISADDRNELANTLTIIPKTRFYF